MLIGRIEGATRVLGKPSGTTDDECAPLAIRDEETPLGNVMVSAWKPTPDEVQRLMRGESIHLYVFGVTHPMVSLIVDGEGPAFLHPREDFKDAEVGMTFDGRVIYGREKLVECFNKQQDWSDDESRDWIEHNVTVGGTVLVVDSE